MESSPYELKLTDDLLEYARKVAIKEARKCCAPRHDYKNVVGEAVMQLIRKPLKFDPSRGASEKTLIYTIVKRAVLRFAEREAKEARKFRQFPERVGAAQDGEDNEPAQNQIGESRTKALRRGRWTLDDMFKYIDNEDSRALCKLVIECDGNNSEAASRLGVSEGTVRYRLKLLAPKLRAAGFDPFPDGEVP